MAKICMIKQIDPRARERSVGLTLSLPLLFLREGSSKDDAEAEDEDDDPHQQLKQLRLCGHDPEEDQHHRSDLQVADHGRTRSLPQVEPGIPQESPDES